MGVLQLGPYPPPHGGVQTHLVAIRDQLRRRGIYAPVINLTRHRQHEGDDVYYPRSVRQVVRLMLTLRADIIHLHIGGRVTGRLLALCFLCCAIPRRRAVLTFHSGGYPSFAGQTVRPRSLRGFVFRRLDAVMVVNAELAALFHRFGVQPSRIHVIVPYTPVSVRDGVALPDPVRAFCDAHAPLLTTVGLLEPEYDLAQQIRALATVRQRFPRAGLIIVGSGSLHDELRTHLAAARAGDHVLLCGDVPHAQTIRLMAESDVFLRTTLYDGDSVSVREALQLGVPVIATDNGMRPGGVHLIPPSNERALCEAIGSVLGAPRSGASRPLAAGDNPVDRVLAVYADVLGHELRAQPARPGPTF